MCIYIYIHVYISNYSSIYVLYIAGSHRYLMNILQLGYNITQTLFESSGTVCNNIKLVIVLRNNCNTQR